MKKFLTVLLALSVVFTYTVGTAFAAVADESTSSLTHDEAIAQAQKELLSELASKANTAKNALA